MLSIDGLATGIDTGSVIEQLLEIEERQVNRELEKQSNVLRKQTAFSGIEARLLSFRGALGRLSNIATSVVNDKLVSSSHEDLVTGAASDNAAVGTYRIRVNETASAHQLGTAAFASPETQITRGDLTIQVGDEAAVTVTIDDTNDSAQGLVDAINSSDADVSATIVNNGSTTSDAYQIVLTSEKTGVSNQIQITNTLAEPTQGELKPAFDVTVNQARDAQIALGSEGAIVVNSATNQFEDVIDGLTLNVSGADTNQEVTLNVNVDSEAGVDAIQNFVDAYNDLVSYFNEQLDFNVDTLVGGPLLGESAVVNIQNQIQQTVSSVVGGLDSKLSTLSGLGVSVQDDGQLSLDTARLRDVLAGNVEGVSTEDVARLFALSGRSTNSGFRFVTVEAKLTTALTRSTSSLRPRKPPYWQTPVCSPRS